MEEFMEEKLNEYKLKLYQHFAFILYGSGDTGSSLFDSMSMKVLKYSIKTMKEQIPFPLFCYKAGIATSIVLQDVFYHEGYDTFEIVCEALSQFMEEWDIC